MKAFTEILSGIVRAGPEADEYGKPFDFAIAFSVDGKVATVKALVSPESGSKVTLAHFRAMEAEFARLGLTCKWVRIK